MDSRVNEIYGKFIRAKKWEKALDVLEAAYEEDKAGAYPLIQRYRRGQTLLARMGEREAWKHLRRSYFLTARDVFDDFIIAMEWERDPSSRFYLPRRKQLLPIVRAMQALYDRRLDVLGVSLPPGTGKTTVSEFFLDFIVGQDPLKGTLTVSHNTNFLRGLYEETLRHLDPFGEYCWHEIFKGHKVVKTNALDLKIDVDKPQRFSSYQFRSISGQNAGLARSQSLTYVDDMVEGIEEALSEDRLEAKWQKLNTDVLQRQGNSDVPLLIVGTRWSVRDPMGRLEAFHKTNKRARFIVFPALNEKDQSNFDYGGSIGFTTKYFRGLRDIMDDASFSALYQGIPVERSGLLFPADEMKRFADLPAGDPDAVWAVCDTKDKGADYCCMPVAYQYGDKYYIVAIVCDNHTPEVVEPRLVNTLIKHKVKMARFESNSAGGRIAEDVQKMVKAKDGITKILTKYSTANKETRIITDSGFVKENFLFRSPDTPGYDNEYRTAMNFLLSYTMSGKNKYDDVPDAMSMLADFVQGNNRTTAVIMKRPF